jgi:CsoR family transcriptional regulator, copper-sensing transcriptional repressor
MSATDEAVTEPPADQVTPEHVTPEHGYTGNKDAYLRRLKRIEGQVRGIARMVDEDKYCIDILTQVSAVTKALHAVSLGLVEEHIGHCVVGAASEPNPELRAEAIDAKVKEAADAIGRLLR